MRAQYSGRCGVCSQSISPGEEIVSGGEASRWIHQGCGTEATLKMPSGAPSPGSAAPDRATVVFTDGSCLVNPGGPGGWAWAVDTRRHDSGPDPSTTNQRMEIRAAYEAVKAHPGPVHVVSDSQYVVNCFAQSWWRGWHSRGWLNSAKKPVANRDLWEPFIALVLERGDVTFEWVKGHAGHDMNEFVDQLAGAAAHRAQAAATGPQLL
ncbi:ribonuclease H family protein [Aeromicrobium sp. CF3.5]|uniref:ribonuclease H family protein n=1 Tax=Aeromicrobium sp. CF3.5 TaxID=3373078 RepID=UPI003EE6BBE6